MLINVILGANRFWMPAVLLFMMLQQGIAQVAGKSVEYVGGAGYVELLKNPQIINTWSTQSSGEKNIFLPKAQNSSGDNSFSIDLIFNEEDGNRISEARKQVFRDSAKRWEKIIVGDLPDMLIEGQVIDDVVIEVQIKPLLRSDGTPDGVGRLLGTAGPRYIRGGGPGQLTAATGIMIFDLPDIRQLESNGRFPMVILHEMAHVLGFGTLWELNEIYSESLDPTRPGYYAAPEGYSAYVSESTENIPAELPGIPLAFGIGAGSDHSHWAEDTLLPNPQSELMTPFIHHLSNYISSTTKAQFKDLGYKVSDADFGLGDIIPWDIPANGTFAMGGITVISGSSNPLPTSNQWTIEYSLIGHASTYDAIQWKDDLGNIWIDSSLNGSFSFPPLRDGPRRIEAQLLRNNTPLANASSSDWIGILVQSPLPAPWKDTWIGTGKPGSPPYRIRNSIILPSGKSSLNASVDNLPYVYTKLEGPFQLITSLPVNTNTEHDFSGLEFRSSLEPESEAFSIGYSSGKWVFTHRNSIGIPRTWQPLDMASVTPMQKFRVLSSDDELSVDYMNNSSEWVNVIRRKAILGDVIYAGLTMTTASENSLSPQFEAPVITLLPYKVPATTTHFRSSPVTIDGLADDWLEISPGIKDRADMIGKLNPVDILSIHISHDSTNFYLASTTVSRHPFDAGFQFYIDTDQNPDTGYSINGIGADRLIQSNQVFKYSGSGTDFKWESPIQINAKSLMNFCEWEIPHRLLDYSQTMNILALADNTFYGGNMMDFAPDVMENMIGNPQNALVYNMPEIENRSNLSLEIPLISRFNNQIAIDGFTDDWEISHHTNIPISENAIKSISTAKMCHNQSWIYYSFILKTLTEAQNTNLTIYLVQESGLENETPGGTPNFMVAHGVLYQSVPDSNHEGNWTWAAISIIPYSMNGRTLELAIPIHLINPGSRFQFFMDDPIESNLLTETGISFTGENPVYLTQIPTSQNVISDIRMDGSETDWNQVNHLKVFDRQELATDAGITDLKSALATHKDENVYIALWGYSAISLTHEQSIFLDTDRSENTGYSVSGIGADLLVQSGQIYKHHSSDRSAFEWLALESIAHATGENFVEFLIPGKHFPGIDSFNWCVISENSSTQDFLPDAGDHANTYLNYDLGTMETTVCESNPCIRIRSRLAPSVSLVAPRPHFSLLNIHKSSDLADWRPEASWPNLLRTTSIQYPEDATSQIHCRFFRLKM